MINLKCILEYSCSSLSTQCNQKIFQHHQKCVRQAFHTWIVLSLSHDSISWIALFFCSVQFNLEKNCQRRLSITTQRRKEKWTTAYLSIFIHMLLLIRMNKRWASKASQFLFFSCFASIGLTQFEWNIVNDKFLSQVHDDNFL